MLGLISSLELYLSTPVHDGAAVGEGLGAAVALSGFVGTDRVFSYSYDKNESVNTSLEYSKRGLKADAKVGYNLSTLVNAIFSMRPFVNVMPYIAVAGEWGAYTSTLTSCRLDSCSSLSESGAHTSATGGVGIKLVSNTRTLRMGIDINGGSAGASHVGVGYAYARLLVGIGYPERLSIGLGTEGYVSGESCGASGCWPSESGGYYTIALSAHHGIYFADGMLYIGRAGGINRINVGFGLLFD